MKSLYNIRFKESIQSMINYLERRNIPVTGKMVDELERDLFNSITIEPSTDGTTFYPFENMDFPRFLSYLHALEADTNFISESLDEIEKGLRDIYLINSVEEYALKSTKSSAKRHLALLSSSTFIDGITKEIRIPDDIQITSSSARESSNRLVMNVEKSIPTNKSNYSVNDTDFIIIKQTTMISNTVEGDRLSILNDSFNRGVKVTVFTLRVEQVGLQCRFRTKFPETNKLTIQLTPASIGTRIKVTVVESIGKTGDLLYDSVVSNEEIVIETNGNRIEDLYIEMFKTFPDRKAPGNMIYEFYIEKIIAENTKTSRLAEAISKAISLPDGTEYVGIVTEDFVPNGSSIKYELATVSNEVSFPNEWFSLIPTNKEPRPVIINNNLPTDRYLATDLGKSKFNIQKSLTWSLSTVSGLRVRAFNILEGNTSAAGDISIISGLVEVADKISVIDDSIKLYNGIGDWEVVNEITKEIIEEKNLILKPKYGNDISDWFDNIDVIETYSETIKTNNDTSTLTLKKIPSQYTNVKIFDSNGNRIAIIVNENLSAGTTTLDTNFTFIKNTIYTIEYTISLLDTSEVMPGTLLLDHNGVTLSPGTDYIYSPGNNKISLVRNGAQGGFTDGTIVRLSYKKRYQPETSGLFYRCWFEIQRTTNITIQPFTQFEVTRGNFHKINGIDISQNNSYTIQAGLHYIESTQPEPSASFPSIGNPAAEFIDVNPYTLTKSSAGIMTDALSIRAFRDPMRRVSLADLEFNVDRPDRKVYSFSEGMILMNKKPSYIEPGFLNNGDQNGRIGEYIRNKKLNTTSKLYESLPEAFMLELSYKTSQSSSFVRMRITMERGGDISPRVERLGISPASIS